MAELFSIGEEATAEYFQRSHSRQKTLMKATMNFVAYFMGLGDDQATAESKVSDTSAEVADKLYLYVLGNTQPLIDALNASTLPHMDAAAKAQITGDLTL